MSTLKMSTTKRVKLSPNTPISPDDTVEVGRDHDLDQSSESKSEVHDHTPSEGIQVNHEDVRQKDPMKIKLVLERVFDFCSVKSLKNCRMVSTEWRDVSLKAWRNKAVLQCSFDFKLEEYLRLVGSDKSDQDDDDVVKFRELKKYPFKRFSLVGPDWNELSSKAMRPISATMRYLRIKVEPVKSSWGWGWEYALKWFPNLEGLSIKYEDIKEPECLDNLRRILGIVKNIRESGGETVLALKELELLTNPNVQTVMLSRKAEEISGLILACNFPLERLSITFGWEMIYQLLESCKDTLQYLEACFEFDVSFAVYKQQFEKKRNCTSTSICMAKLKEARIGNGFLRAMDLLTLLELPLMEKLTIEGIKRDWIATISYPPSLPKGKVYETLKTLEILDNHTMLLRYMIQKFAKMMPHLIHLTIPLDKEMFRIVCDKFKGLRTLNILSPKWPHSSHGDLDDESMTGIAREAKDGAQRQPNITDLALLTDLKISCDDRVRVGFSDHSVIHGFLHLPRLYSLSIAFKDLSEEIRTKLVDHVKGDLYIQEIPVGDAKIGEDCENDSDEEEDSSDYSYRD